jgi:hypothetical protein
MSKSFSFSSLFGNNDSTKPVSQILSGINSLITDLKTAVASHTTKIAENEAQIEALEAANQASQDEIAQATAAQTNLATLIGIK